MHIPNPTSSHSNERVKLSTKIVWGFGGLADNFMFNTLTALGTLVYVQHFGLSPALAGMALAFPRLIDAFTDPWIGNLSDNLKSRFGRRRPLMFCGVLICALILPFLWTPFGADTALNPWYSNLPFFYIIIVGSILAVAYTLFVVPYTALGFEISPNYDERTRVIVWRMYIGLIGSVSAGWLFRIAAADVFPNLGTGAVIVSIGVSIVVLVAGLIPTFGCKENPQFKTQSKIKLFPAIKYTMTNKPFVILFIAYVTIIVALFSAQSIAPLLLLHYVFNGSEKAIGDFTGWLTTLAVFLSYLSMFFIGYLSNRYDKRTALLIGLSFVLLGTFLNFFAIDPRWQWALFVAGGITFIGMQGCWLMIDSMVADVCDEDEIKTGRRREGMFSSAKGFALKAAQGLTFGIGGYMATLAGYDPQKIDAVGLDTTTAIKMKSLLIGFQSFGLLLAIILVCFYPISRKRAERTQQLLKLRSKEKESKED